MVIINVGSLAVVSLVVVTGVSVVVTLILLVVTRDSRPRVEHCSQCHQQIYIKQAKVPPYYNSHQSPRHAEQRPTVRGGGGTGGARGGEPLETTVRAGVARARSSGLHTAGVLRPSDQDSMVFKRSCSTRKKIKNTQSESLRSQEESGSFFRCLFSCSDCLPSPWSP